ncbi:hypothetical protein AB0M86_13095 [Streptomyces sp. NPDC051639]
MAERDVRRAAVRVERLNGALAAEQPKLSRLPARSPLLSLAEHL